MYTLLVNHDHSVIATNKTTIMQRSKLVDTIQVLVPKIYDDIDMTGAVVRLEYLTPGNTYRFQLLTLNNPGYKNDYLQYLIKGDTDITAEAGDLNCRLSFYLLEQVDGKEILQRVRETLNFKLPITPASAWSMQIPDDVLDPLSQLILAQMAVNKETEALARQLYDDGAKDIQIDEISNKIKLLARSGQIGEGLDVDTLARKIADIILAPDLDGTEDGVTYLDEIPASADAANLDELLKK